MPEPKDPLGFTYYLMLLMVGVGLLLPWNTFITAVDLFTHLYPGINMEFLFAIFYNAPNFVILMVMIKWGHKVPYTIGIIVPLAISTVILVIVPIQALLLPMYASLGLTLLCVSITGTSTGILFAATFGMAALFPGRYTQSLMSGIGVAGIIVAAIRILTKLALPANTEGLIISSLIYFAIAAFVVLIAILCFFIFRYSPYARYYFRRAARTVEYDESEILYNDSNNNDPDNKETAPLRPKDDNDPIDVIITDAEKGIPQDSDVIVKSTPPDAGDALLESNNESGEPKAKILSVLAQLWPQALNVFMVFLVTLALFPSVVTIIPSTWNMPSWFPILIVTLFMIFDFVGRTLPRWQLFVVVSPKWLWALVWSRLIFFPLFILCVRPKLFMADGWAYGFMVIFALSNGYAGSLAMMYGPNCVRNHEKALGGSIMAYFLNMGVLFGSFVAAPVLGFIHLMPDLTFTW